MAMINVWYPDYVNGQMNVGHSSLLLDRLQRPVYISWWPQAAQTKTPTWKFDVSDKGEGGLPDVMISLDDLEELLHGRRRCSFDRR